MWKHANAGDIIVIGLSAYIVIWGANRMLRAVGMTMYQA